MIFGPKSLTMIILISVTMGGNSKTAKKKLKAAADVTKISTKLGKVIKQLRCQLLYK